MNSKSNIVESDQTPRRSQPAGVSSKPKYRQAPGVSASAHPDGLVLLNTEEGLLFKTNSIGAHIWEGVLSGLPIQTIAAQISAEYRVPPTQAEHDVVDFASDLCKRRLLIDSE